MSSLAIIMDLPPPLTLDPEWENCLVFFFFCFFFFFTARTLCCRMTVGPGLVKNLDEPAPQPI